MPPYPARSGSLLALNADTRFWDKYKRLDGLSQSWNTLFRYIVFFFKVISGIRYQTFYKSLAILVSYEDKSGYVGIPPSPTLTPSMRAGPENMEGRSPCRENNDSLPIQIPWCDMHFEKLKEEKLIQLDLFSPGEKQKFRLSQRFWSTTVYVATWP